MSKRKKIWGAAILVIVLIAAFFVWQNFANKKVETHYVLTKVEKGSLMKTISGSGQVSVSNQVEIQPKVSGDVTNVLVSAGLEVKTGDTLVQLNASDAYKTLRDAQVSLASARLSLEKLKAPADDLSILQAEHALAQAQESKQDAEADLAKAYEDGFNDIANAFLDLPTIMSGLSDLLYSRTLNTNQSNVDYYADSAKYYDEKILQYRDDANDSYDQARLSYDQNFTDYKNATRASSTEIIEALVEETYQTSKDIAEAVKSANNLIQFYKDLLTVRNIPLQTLSSTHLTTLDGYTSKANTNISNLLSIKQTIQNDKSNIINYDRSIAEKTESLADLKAGTDPLDIRAQELAVQQKINALTDAQEKLADYTIKAPFDGVLATVDVKKGDTASSATSVATIITQQKVAEISLNEVDAAKVQTGQKVTLTFDAVEGLSLTGEVAEVDTLGTVSQGVVTYGIKIVFDTQDDRVKSGMSVSVVIIIDMKPDVLLLPSAAVKTNGGSSYVEVPNEEIDSSLANSAGVVLKNQPQQKIVQLGLDNDTSTEIISGLEEGAWVILRTVNSVSTNNSTNSNNKSGSIFQMTGGGMPPSGR